LAESIASSAPRLKIVSAERIRDEFFKMLLHPTADLALDDLMSLGLLAQFLPEFLPLKGCEQGKWHHLDAWDHTRLVVKNVHSSSSDSDIITILAALFHDVAKPQTRTEPIPGEVHFYGHDHEGATVARVALKRLKVQSNTIESVAFLTENHMRLSSASKFGIPAIRRLIRDMGDHLNDFLDLCESDRVAHKDAQPLTELRQRIEAVRTETPAGSLESPLSGEEIMSLLNLKSGPEVGMWKQKLVDAVIEGIVTDSDSAHTWLLQQR
jgi:poly(A) polymerase